ncbi:MAG: hypothetical protein K2X81_28965, partial [Candidatus Obscuribacterales bacterium]|nr:hypothetical protein [Candidatus Obscuribacterales bacterium]
MQKNAMISVKEAASLLDLDERSIRERLINGSLKGEKRSHGQREKWFVSAGAIEVELKQKKSSQTVSEMLNNLNSQEATSPMNFNPGQQQAFPQPPAQQEPNTVQQGFYSQPSHQAPPENF